MDRDDFRAAVATATDEEEIDVLCFKWLRDLAEYYGVEGDIVKKLLRIIEQIITE